VELTEKIPMKALSIAKSDNRLKAIIHSLGRQLTRREGGIDDLMKFL
jgi:hypothetical protein